MMSTKEPRIEEMFAIGRPAKAGSGWRTCRRCRGTGWWQLGRKCFACGGVGRAEISTTATKLRDKKKHVAEVREIIAREKALLPTTRFGRKSREREIARREEQLLILEAEVAVLEAAP
jgi:hypothetical protein